MGNGENIFNEINKFNFQFIKRRKFTHGIYNKNDNIKNIKKDKEISKELVYIKKDRKTTVHKKFIFN